VVLTRGAERDAQREAAHVALSKLSTNSRYNLIEGAGHEIHLFDPPAVITAINDVVAAVASKARLARR
jgi:hypothetical protein